MVLIVKRPEALLAGGCHAVPSPGRLICLCPDTGFAYAKATPRVEAHAAPQVFGWAGCHHVPGSDTLSTYGALCALLGRSRRREVR